MKLNFLYQITAASRSPFSLSSVLNWICWAPPPPAQTKFLGTPLSLTTYLIWFFLSIESVNSTPMVNRVYSTDSISSTTLGYYLTYCPNHFYYYPINWLY